MSRVNQRVDQNRIELAQPGQHDCQHMIVVRVPWRPPARHAAAAFHDESKMTALGLDEVFSIHDAAMVINQLHESEAPTYRRVMSRTTPPNDLLLRRLVCAAGQLACAQVSRCIGMAGSDREFPAVTGRSGTQRSRPLWGRARRLAPRRPGPRHYPAIYAFDYRSAVSVLIVNIDEWGNAVTLAVCFVCLIGAIVMYAKHKRRIAAYLALVAYLLFLPVRLWFFQFELTVRGSIGVAYISEVVVVQLILGGIVPLVVSCFYRFRPILTGLLLAYVLSLLLQFFSYAYWTYGTKQNFTISLSHLDSFYFALGTLTTAGTGTISAISETSRGYQTLQMALDLALVGFVVVVIMARYVSLLSSRTQVTAPGEMATMHKSAKRVAAGPADMQPSGQSEPERSAAPKLVEKSHSDHCTW